MIELTRKTKETSIEVKLNINGSGQYKIDTGIGFFNHMLEALSKHSGVDLFVHAEGDLDVDFHHTVEDVGIVIGKALKEAVKNINIARYGYAIIAMDEALVLTSIDFCNRIFLNFDCNINGSIGNFDSELIEEFFKALVSNSGMVLHIKQLYGANKHHIAEAIFKSFAHSLKMALKPAQSVLSTKGSL